MSYSLYRLRCRVEVLLNQKWESSSMGESLPYYVKYVVPAYASSPQKSIKGTNQGQGHGSVGKSTSLYCFVCLFFLNCCDKAPRPRKGKRESVYHFYSLRGLESMIVMVESLVSGRQPWH